MRPTTNSDGKSDKYVCHGTHNHVVHGVLTVCLRSSSNISTATLITSACAKMSSCRYNIPEELVYKGGNVLIHTGTKNSGVFLVHSAVLRRNSHFFDVALSGIWMKPVKLIINGIVRKVRGFDMFFDYDTQLPLLKPLQDQINPHRHIMPENAAANKSFTKQWATTNHGDRFRILLNTHVSLAHIDVYVPPRQFSFTDIQPTKYAPLKYFFEYNQPSQDEEGEDEVMPARLETNRHASTYGLFFDGHTQFLPAFGGTRNGYNDRRSEAYPTHEATRRHLQAMWSMLLRAFYNLTTY